VGGLENIILSWPRKTFDLILAKEEFELLKRYALERESDELS
jgi:hypothetical protein